MWNLKDGNKIVGMQDKVDRFKKHLHAMSIMKPFVKIQQPWKPSFSLSKFKNKYQKVNNLQLSRSNQNLISHLWQIDNKNSLQTFMHIPKTIPSNKQTFKSFKKRQRLRQSITVNRQNQKIYSKIISMTSQYSKDNHEKQWKQNLKYKSNILRKQSNPDFYQLARMSSIGQNEGKNSYLLQRGQSVKVSRPKTALPR